MSSDDLIEYARQRVVEAAIAYCAGTNPDDHALDIEMRAAVRELTKLVEEGR